MSTSNIWKRTRSKGICSALAQVRPLVLQSCQQCRHSWSSTSHTAKTSRRNTQMGSGSVLYFPDFRLEYMTVSCSVPFLCLNRGRGAAPNSDLQHTRATMLLQVPQTCGRMTCFNTCESQWKAKELSSHASLHLHNAQQTFSWKTQWGRQRNHHRESSTWYWVSSELLWCCVLTWPDARCPPSCSFPPQKNRGEKEDEKFVGWGKQQGDHSAIIITGKTDLTQGKLM